MVVVVQEESIQGDSQAIYYLLTEIFIGKLSTQVDFRNSETSLLRMVVV